jgi:ACR3 family arsenite efflux pump ArsB
MGGEVDERVSLFSQLQPVLIIVSALVGVALGRFIDPIGDYAGYLVEPFLIIMLFFVFLSVDVKEITKSFSDRIFAVTSLVINFIFTPVFSFLLAMVFFAGYTDLQIGFIMLMVTPCTDWYLVFTRLAGGNVPLGSSMLPLNLILQVLLLPVYLLIFMGASVAIEPTTILLSILFVLVVPLIVANIVKHIFIKLKRNSTLDRITSKSDDIQFMLLCFAVGAMFASQGVVLMSNLFVFVRLLPPLLIFFAAIAGISLFVGRRLKLSFQNTVSLLFTTSARNSPISLAIATITFPLQPLISLVLVMGPLIELPVLALESTVVGRIGKRRQ